MPGLALSFLRVSSSRELIALNGVRVERQRATGSGVLRGGCVGEVCAGIPCVSAAVLNLMTSNSLGCFLHEAGRVAARTHPLSISCSSAGGPKKRGGKAEPEWPPYFYRYQQTADALTRMR